jgi:hypothetical protein
VGDVDREALSTVEGGHRFDDRLVTGRELPGPAAAAAIEVGVLGRGQDVELLATTRAVAVADHPEILEHVEGAIDGRRDGVGRDRPTSSAPVT